MYIDMLNIQGVAKGKNTIQTNSIEHHDIYKFLGEIISCLIQCIPLVYNKFLKPSYQLSKTLMELSSRNKRRKRSVLQVMRNYHFKIFFHVTEVNFDLLNHLHAI